MGPRHRPPFLPVSSRWGKRGEASRRQLACPGLSAADAGLGAPFLGQEQPRCIRRGTGDPRLGESSWDTARSISDWPESTVAGPQVPEPAATSLPLPAPAGSVELGSGHGAWGSTQQTDERRQQEQRSRARRHTQTAELHPAQNVSLNTLHISTTTPKLQGDHETGPSC